MTNEPTAAEVEALARIIYEPNWRLFEKEARRVLAAGYALPAEPHVDPPCWCGAETTESFGVLVCTESVYHVPSVECVDLMAATLDAEDET